MSSVWNKLDANLAAMYARFLAARQKGQAGSGERLAISLEFSGDLAAIEPLGFDTIVEEGDGRATGAVALSDLEQIASHPNVVRLLAGDEMTPDLDISAKDVRARTDAMPGLWTVPNTSPPAFGGLQTGPPALIGIIDTGIDYLHPFFTNVDGTGTRIVRIWDPGLSPMGAESPPNALVLDFGGNTYGVEYTKDDIENALAGIGTIRHRDCHGHGTHVASIAAGNGQPDFQYIGVAPEADLIIVKVAFHSGTPTVHAGPMAGTVVPPGRLFKDCVTYIRRTAADLGRPVAINYSFGSALGPHDGFTDAEDWLRTEFATAAGQVFVTSAGNAGRLADRQHARIEFTATTPPADETKTIPIELYDPRPIKYDFHTCVLADNTKPLSLEVYYKTGGPAVTFDFDIPDHTTPAPPALGGAAVGMGDTFGTGQTYLMTHIDDGITLRGGAGTVNRNKFRVQLSPSGNEHYATAKKYILRITTRVTTPEPFVLHLWCQQAVRYGLKIATTGVSPVGVMVDNKSTIGSSAGAANIITVASYDAAATALPLAASSSRGPLIKWSGPTPARKPDMAAPGVGIDAAKSSDSRPATATPGVTIPLGGTSMAAPHVAGAAALLLAKQTTLTSADVIMNLQRSVRLVPVTDEDELGEGRLDARAAWDNTI